MPRPFHGQSEVKLTKTNYLPSRAFCRLMRCGYMCLFRVLIGSLAWLRLLWLVRIMTVSGFTTRTWKPLYERLVGVTWIKPSFSSTHKLEMEFTTCSKFYFKKEIKHHRRVSLKPPHSKVRTSFFFYTLGACQVFPWVTPRSLASQTSPKEHVKDFGWRCQSCSHNPILWKGTSPGCGLRSPEFSFFACF